MNGTRRTAFADPELVELFAGEPELLAIADAVAATTPKRTEVRLAGPRRRRFARPTVLSVAIAVVAAVAVALVAPW
ncbi:MAG: hypothetical protein ACRD2I_05530, partial [Vicinamibacterales bacterium]